MKPTNMITLPLMSSNDTLFVDYETLSRHLLWLFNVVMQHTEMNLNSPASRYRAALETWSRSREAINKARRLNKKPETLNRLEAEEVEQIALMKQLTAEMEELIFVTYHAAICEELKHRDNAHQTFNVTAVAEREYVETIAKLFGRDNFGCKHQQQQDDGCVVM